MKKKSVLCIILLTTFIFTCSQNKGTFPWQKTVFTEDSNSRKIIMLDFYNKGCPPCEQLLKETFTDLKVIDFAKENLSCYKIDTWAEKNNDIRVKYNVLALPVLVFLNDEKQEIERITNFVPPSEFLSELKRIKNNEKTYLFYFEQYKQDSTNLDVLFNLALKVENMENYMNRDRSMSLWKKYLNHHI